MRDLINVFVRTIVQRNKKQIKLKENINISKLKFLVSQGKEDEALALIISNIDKVSDNNLKNDLLHTSSRLQKLLREKKLGILSNEISNVSSNQITNSILSLINEIEERQIVHIKQKNKIILIYGVFAFSIFIIIMLLQTGNASRVALKSQSKHKAKFLIEPVQIVGNSHLRNTEQIIDSIWEMRQGRILKNNYSYQLGNSYFDTFIDTFIFNNLYNNQTLVWDIDFSSCCGDVEANKYFFPLIICTIRNVGELPGTIYRLSSKIIGIADGHSAQPSFALKPLNERFRLYPGKNLIFDKPIFFDINSVGTIQFSPTFRDKDIPMESSPPSMLFSVSAICFDGKDKIEVLLGYYRVDEAITY